MARIPNQKELRFSRWKWEKEAESGEGHARKLAMLKGRLQRFVMEELPWANVYRESGRIIIRERVGLNEKTLPGQIFGRNEAIEELLARMGIEEEHVRRFGETLAENVGTEGKIPFKGKIVKVNQKNIREAVAEMLRKRIPEEPGELHGGNEWGGSHWAKAILEAGSLIKRQEVKKKRTQEYWKYRKN